MTTLLNLLYSIPALIGAFCAVKAMVVLFAPWDRIARYCMLIPLIAVICIVLWFEDLCKRFCNWMRKHEAWEDDLPDLFI